MLDGVRAFVAAPSLEGVVELLKRWNTASDDPNVLLEAAVS